MCPSKQWSDPSRFNAAQAHNTVNAKDFNYRDWYKDTLGIAKAESHFNKSEAASGFINPANDFAGYMNMLTSQLSPAPQYHNFVESSPTSAQPKSVVPQTRSPAGSLSKFIYDNQDNWMGKGLYGLVKVMSSDTVSRMAAGADQVAEFAKPMNPFIMGSEVITGVDPYTGVPVSRLEAATAFAFDVAGGEIFSFAGKGLSMVLAPGANASLGSVLMMGAKLQLGNLLESELATTVFSGVDSALIQPIKGLGQRVGVFGGRAENSLVDAGLLRRSHNISGRASSRVVNDIANEMKTGNYEGPPIDVVQDESGQMYIVDGHHRVASAKMTGTKVEVNIIHDIELHPSSYESIEEIINDSFSVGRDKLRPMK